MHMKISILTGNGLIWISSSCPRQSLHQKGLLFELQMSEPIEYMSNNTLNFTYSLALKVTRQVGSVLVYCLLIMMWMS